MFMDYETGFKASRSGGCLKIGVVAEQTLYTTEQMQQIVDMVVQNLLPQGQKVPENLDNERAQCSLSPYAKLTCSVSEAAKILGISKPTMYDLVHKGTIPSITVGRKILISRTALIDWLENGGTHGKEAC